jgi:hypothetical protein
VQMDFKDIILGGLDWVCLCRREVKMGMCEHSNEPLGNIRAGIFCTSTGNISFSGMSLHCELNTLQGFEVHKEEMCTEQLLWVRCNE